MIPVFEPQFLGNEQQYLSECIETGWISSEGPFVQRFEAAMADHFGMAQGVAVSSGTAALETALYALQLAPGSEVILPSFTIISCVAACLRLDLVPVLVDLQQDTWTMDPSQVAARVSARTSAIMAVHIYGNPVDVDPICEVARAHHLPVVEDFAEAIGAGYRSGSDSKRHPCGGIGEVSVTSFYANKNIACGEGGMVLCHHQAHADRARQYRNLCFDADRRFVHENLGCNYRMTNLQAAVGLAQLERLEQTLAKKRQIADWYRSALGEVAGVRFHPIPAWSEPAYWMYCVQLDPARGHNAADVTGRLRSQQVGTRFFFRGMHRQPALQRRGLFPGETYPRCDQATEYGFYLPSSLNLTAQKVDAIAAALKRAIR